MDDREVWEEKETCSRDEKHSQFSSCAVLKHYVRLDAPESSHFNLAIVGGSDEVSEPGSANTAARLGQSSPPDPSLFLPGGPPDSHTYIYEFRNIFQR